MNSRRLLPLILSATALAAYAQEAPAPAAPAASELGAPAAPAASAPAAPAPSTKADPALDLMPAQPGQLRPPPATDPALPLIPQAPESAPKKRSDGDKPKKSKTEAAEEEQTALIRLREAKTRALTSDPTFIKEFHDANARHTDLEKREALKKYYQRLYARIRKIDPTTKKLAMEREQEALSRLVQRRIAPTEPLNAAERSVSPTLSADSYLGADF